MENQRLGLKEQIIRLLLHYLPEYPRTEISSSHIFLLLPTLISIPISAHECAYWEGPFSHLFLNLIEETSTVVG